MTRTHTSLVHQHDIIIKQRVTIRPPSENGLIIIIVYLLLACPPLYLNDDANVVDGFDVQQITTLIRPQ